MEVSRPVTKRKTKKKHSQREKPKVIPKEVEIKESVTFNEIRIEEPPDFPAVERQVEEAETPEIQLDESSSQVVESVETPQINEFSQLRSLHQSISAEALEYPSVERTAPLQVTPPTIFTLFQEKLSEITEYVTSFSEWFRTRTSTSSFTFPLDESSQTISQTNEFLKLLRKFVEIQKKIDETTNELSSIEAQLDTVNSSVWTLTPLSITQTHTCGDYSSVNYTFGYTKAVYSSENLAALSTLLTAQRTYANLLRTLRIAVSYASLRIDVFLLIFLSIQGAYPRIDQVITPEMTNLQYTTCLVQYIDMLYYFLRENTSETVKNALSKWISLLTSLSQCSESNVQFLQCFSLQHAIRTRGVTRFLDTLTFNAKKSLERTHVFTLLTMLFDTSHELVRDVHHSSDDLSADIGLPESDFCNLMESIPVSVLIKQISAHVRTDSEQCFVDLHVFVSVCERVLENLNCVNVEYTQVSRRVGKFVTLIPWSIVEVISGGPDAVAVERELDWLFLHCVAVLYESKQKINVFLCDLPLFALSSEMKFYVLSKILSNESFDLEINPPISHGINPEIDCSVFREKFVEILTADSEALHTLNFLVQLAVADATDTLARVVAKELFYYLFLCAKTRETYYRESLRLFPLLVHAHCSAFSVLLAEIALNYDCIADFAVVLLQSIDLSQHNWRPRATDLLHLENLLLSSVIGRRKVADCVLQNLRFGDFSPELHREIAFLLGKLRVAQLQNSNSLMRFGVLYREFDKNWWISRLLSLDLFKSSDTVGNLTDAQFPNPDFSCPTESTDFVLQFLRIELLYSAKMRTFVRAEFRNELHDLSAPIWLQLQLVHSNAVELFYRVISDVFWVAHTHFVGIIPKVLKTNEFRTILSILKNSERRKSEIQLFAKTIAQQILCAKSDEIVTIWLTEIFEIPSKENAPLWFKDENIRLLVENIILAMLQCNKTQMQRKIAFFTVFSQKYMQSLHFLLNSNYTEAVRTAPHLSFVLLFKEAETSLPAYERTLQQIADYPLTLSLFEVAKRENIPKAALSRVLVGSWLRYALAVPSGCILAESYWEIFFFLFFYKVKGQVCGYRILDTKTGRKLLAAAAVKLSELGLENFREKIAHSLEKNCVSIDWINQTPVEEFLFHMKLDFSTAEPPRLRNPRASHISLSRKLRLNLDREIPAVLIPEISIPQAFLGPLDAERMSFLIHSTADSNASVEETSSLLNADYVELFPMLYTNRNTTTRVSRACHLQNSCRAPAFFVFQHSVSSENEQVLHIMAENRVRYDSLYEEWSLTEELVENLVRLEAFSQFLCKEKDIFATEKDKIGLEWFFWSLRVIDCNVRTCAVLRDVLLKISRRLSVFVSNRSRDQFKVFEMLRVSSVTVDETLAQVVQPEKCFVELFETAVKFRLDDGLISELILFRFTVSCFMRQERKICECEELFDCFMRVLRYEMSEFRTSRRIAAIESFLCDQLRALSDAFPQYLCVRMVENVFQSTLDASYSLCLWEKLRGDYSAIGWSHFHRILVGINAFFVDFTAKKGNFFTEWTLFLPYFIRFFTDFLKSAAGLFSAASARPVSTFTAQKAIIWTTVTSLLVQFGIKTTGYSMEISPIVEETLRGLVDSILLYQKIDASVHAKLWEFCFLHIFTRRNVHSEAHFALFVRCLCRFDWSEMECSVTQLSLLLRGLERGGPCCARLGARIVSSARLLEVENCGETAVFLVIRLCSILDFPISEEFRMKMAVLCAVNWNALYSDEYCRLMSQVLQVLLSENTRFYDISPAGDETVGERRFGVINLLFCTAVVSFESGEVSVQTLQCSYEKLAQFMSFLHQILAEAFLDAAQLKELCDCIFDYFGELFGNKCAIALSHNSLELYVLHILKEFIRLLGVDAYREFVWESVLRSPSEFLWFMLKSVCRFVISVDSMTLALEEIIATLISRGESWDFVSAAVEIPQLSEKEFIDFSVKNSCIFVLTCVCLIRIQSSARNDIQRILVLEEFVPQSAKVKVSVGNQWKCVEFWLILYAQIVGISDLRNDFVQLVRKLLSVLRRHCDDNLFSGVISFLGLSKSSVSVEFQIACRVLSGFGLFLLRDDERFENCVTALLEMKKTNESLVGLIDNVVGELRLMKLGNGEPYDVVLLRVRRTVRDCREHESVMSNQ